MVWGGARWWSWVTAQATGSGRTAAGSKQNTMAGEQ